MKLLKLYALAGSDNTELRELKLDEFVQKEFTVKTYEAFQQLANKWVEFNGVYTPDYNEGLYIENFSLPTVFKTENMAVEMNSKESAAIEPNALFTYLEKETAYLFFKAPGSNVLPAEVYQRKIPNEIMQKIFPPMVNIKGKIACVYKDHTLYFTSYYDARQIFDLEPYYEAAVKKEISTLKKQPSFNQEDEIQWSESLDLLLNGNESTRMSEKWKSAVNQTNEKYNSDKQDACSSETTDQSKRR